MKLVPAIALAAAFVAAPFQSQAFFVDQKALDYKLHILECAGLLFSERHAAECGGTVGTGPFPSLSTPVSPSGPPAAPLPVDDGDDDCYLGSADLLNYVRDLPIGASVDVAAETWPSYPCTTY